MKSIRKSFKREIAVLGLVFWGIITGHMFWSDVDVLRLEALTTPYDAVTWTTWTYAAAAFGLHAIATQWGQKG